MTFDGVLDRLYFNDGLLRNDGMRGFSKTDNGTGTRVSRTSTPWSVHSRPVYNPASLHRT